MNRNKKLLIRFYGYIKYSYGYINNATPSRSKKMLVNTFLKQKGNGNHVQQHYDTKIFFTYGTKS